MVMQSLTQRKCWVTLVWLSQEWCSFWQVHLSSFLICYKSLSKGESWLCSFFFFFQIRSAVSIWETCFIALRNVLIHKCTGFLKNFSPPSLWVTSLLHFHNPHNILEHGWVAANLQNPLQFLGNHDAATLLALTKYEFFCYLCLRNTFLHLICISRPNLSEYIRTQLWARRSHYSSKTLLLPVSCLR